MVGLLCQAGRYRLVFCGAGRGRQQGRTGAGHDQRNSSHAGHEDHRSEHDAKKNQGKIYAALYELNDKELITALQAFGKDCNLILANGAFKTNSPPNNDENAAVRVQLKGKINVFDRIVKLGHFGHNKFVVICAADGKPQQVLTGSTNWTSSGLCTQANNALIIADPNVAGDFLEAWNRIRAAGDDYTPALINGNSTSKTYQVDGCRVTPWFVKTSAGQDLQFARKLINAAKDGVLFLFFNPGTFQDDPVHWTLLQNILARHNQSDHNYKPQPVRARRRQPGHPATHETRGAAKGSETTGCGA